MEDGHEPAAPLVRRGGGRRRGVLAARDVVGSLAGAAAGWGAAIACYGLLRVGRRPVDEGERLLLSLAVLLGAAMLIAWLGALASLAAARRTPSPLLAVLSGGALTLLAFLTLIGAGAAGSPVLLISTAAPGLIGGGVYALLAGSGENGG